MTTPDSPAADRAGSVVLTTSSAEETLELGRRLAASLRRGDLILLVGALGAGKTTFARGLGDGLGVRGDVTSPTFVLARVHPNRSDRPALLHVDAYRLNGETELDDLDIDSLTDSAVTVVEWGEHVAEGLSDSRLRVELTRSSSMQEGDDRVITVSAYGPRWIGSRLDELFTVASR